MKKYNKLDGDKYTFKKKNLIKNYNKYIDTYEEKLKNIFKSKDSKLLNKIFETSIFKDIIHSKILYNNFTKIIETAGRIFGFDDSNIYNIKSYNKGLLNALSSVEDIEIDKIKKQIKELTNLIDRRKIVKHFYNEIKEDKITFKYIIPFTNEFLVALYIYVVKPSRITY